MKKSAWSRLAAELAAVATPSGRARYRAFSIEGLRAFERALAADARIERALVADDVLARPNERAARVLDALAQRAVPIVGAPVETLAELTAGRDLGGLLGLVACSAPIELGTLLNAHAEARLLVLVDVEDPGNVGALVRTALASGALACVCIGQSDPWHPKAVRTSMGSVFRLPLVRFERTAEFDAVCAAHDVMTWAAVARDGQACGKAPRAARTAIVVGSEAFGLDDEFARRCDQRVSIPMPGAVDSFSVNAAAAILLYELGARALPAE